MRASTIWVWILAGSLLALGSGCERRKPNLYCDSVDKPIHEAARAGDVGIVAGEIASGVPVDVRGEGGLTPLQLAAGQGKDDVVLLLINNGASIDGEVETSWKKEKSSLFQPFFIRSPLCFAAGAGHLSTARLLLDRGADPDHWAYPPLFCASWSGDVRIVELLLERGAPPEKLHQGAMLLAVEKGHEEMVDFLVGKGVSLTAPGMVGKITTTPLHSAACAGQIRMAEKILRAGAAVDAANSWPGGTPLFDAAICDQAEMVRFLAKAGADVNRRANSNTNTPLFMAMASHGDNFDCVEALLVAGADPNLDPYLPLKGRTPLHWAAYWNHPKLVEILLAHGADPRAVSEKGLTPLQEALAADEGKGHMECARILEAAMAKTGAPAGLPARPSP